MSAQTAVWASLVASLLALAPGPSPARATVGPSADTHDHLGSSCAPAADAAPHALRAPPHRYVPRQRAVHPAPRAARAPARTSEASRASRREAIPRYAPALDDP